MNHALRNQTSPGGDYWNNKNLTKCFVDCMRNLWVGLQKQSIKDIFFPEVSIYLIADLKDVCSDILVYTVQYVGQTGPHHPGAVLQVAG